MRTGSEGHLKRRGISLRGLTLWCDTDAVAPAHANERHGSSTAGGTLASMTAFSFVLSILDLIHTHSSLKTHQSRDRVLFMGGVTELYLSPVSDTHVCSTLSRLH